MRASVAAVRPSAAVATNVRTRRSQRHADARGSVVSPSPVTAATGSGAAPAVSVMVTGMPAGARRANAIQPRSAVVAASASGSWAEAAAGVPASANATSIPAAGMGDGRMQGALTA